jgi:hypothetical protein
MSEQQRLQALNGGSSIDFWGNESPKCPHCGQDFDIQDAEAWDLYSDDDTHEVECQSCELEFSVTTNVRYTFTTSDQDED